MNKLGVRPYSEPNESLLGYCVRLSKRNGLSGLRMLYDLIGVPNIGKNKSRSELDRSEVILEKLAPILGRDLSVLREAFSAQSPVWVYDEKRLIQDIRIEHPRICPNCIIEKGFVDWRWGLAHLSTCPEHQVLLLDACPSCNKPLDWHSSLLQGCHKCGATWEGMDISKRPITSLEEKAWVHATDNPSNYKDLLTDICAAIVVAGRPYDSYHDRRNHAPTISEYSSVVSLAYKILTDTWTQEAWIGSCKAERDVCLPLGDKVTYAPVLSLEKHARTFKVTDIYGSSGGSDSTTFEENAEFVKQSRFNVIPASSDTDLLRYQVSSSQLTKMLGLPNGCIQQMVDDGVIKPCNSTNVLRDQLFDMRQFSKLFSDACQAEASGRLVTPKSKELTTHLTSYGKVLSDVASGVLNGSITDSSELNQIVVNELQYKKWLAAMLENACSETVPAYKAQAALKCGDKKIKTLIHRGEIKCSRLCTSYGSIDGNSLLEFITKTMK
ncbi:MULTISPECIES: TniQ family protein [unclassified Neptuniibacter]|uniref:TniQ family protein n=1 Tax=unclassified Neptuniibacter TaxID=2630693 RepID=UPI0025CEF109|nr:MULTISPECIES: TniQ family protein [unclassified Neptuniibacter]|tara:strand:+ start:26138 stop:27625 length:1488 start_codon:yes stop_codon:yes gene_type:complete